MMIEWRLHLMRSVFIYPLEMITVITPETPASDCVWVVVVCCCRQNLVAVKLGL